MTDEEMVKLIAETQEFLATKYPPMISQLFDGEYDSNEPL